MMDSQEYWKKKFQFRKAEKYGSIEQISQKFPDLADVNKKMNWDKQEVHGIIIRSHNDDNIQKAIKYGVWTTTFSNIKKLEEAYNKYKHIFLFFTTSNSGMFEGVAQLTSFKWGATFPYWWPIGNNFHHCFQIQWVYIKDVNHYHCQDILAIQGESVTKCRDCTEISPTQTIKLLKIFDKKPANGKWIFKDFDILDIRQQKIRTAVDHNI